MTAAASGPGTIQMQVKNRLDRAMARKPALICYLPTGDPTAPPDLADLYVEQGVDVLEIGIPVPNPYVDGETIRASMERVRQAGVDAAKIATISGRIRRRHPGQAMVWMSYASGMAAHDLVRLANRAGIDGLLFVEPARLFGKLSDDLADIGIHLLHFMPRGLPRPDVLAARSSGGYVMLQARNGPTGGGASQRRLPDSKRQIRELHKAKVRTPIALGIGIRTPAQARRAIEMGADGVIIGSEMVRLAQLGADAVADYLTEMRQALQ